MCLSKLRKIFGRKYIKKDRITEYPGDLDNSIQKGRLYKHRAIPKSGVNAPKRQPCPKCQYQAKRVRKTESTKAMPAMAFYQCRCKNHFEVVLKRQ